MKRRSLIRTAFLSAGGLMVSGVCAQAKTYLTIDQAKKVLWGNVGMSPLPITLAKTQMKSIQKESKVRVRHATIQAWKTSTGGWFIVDQIIGKHENIDIAVALTSQGKVKGIEVLTYRESYGHEIRNAKWRAQFHGKGPGEHLKLDKQIKNISGATLSCRHITDGINRLTVTWNQVMRHK